MISGHCDCTIDGNEGKLTMPVPSQGATILSHGPPSGQHDNPGFQTEIFKVDERGKKKMMSQFNISLNWKQSGPCHVHDYFYFFVATAKMIQDMSVIFPSNF